MSEPTQTCGVCGGSVTVLQTGRGYPPEIARRKLAKRCRAAGHESAITYRAGIAPDLMQRLRESIDAARSARPVGVSVPEETGEKYVLHPHEDET